MLRIDDLADKSILITGASSGIGAAISRAFAGQGAKVAVHCKDNAEAAARVRDAIRSNGGFACVVQGDLTEAGEAKRIVQDSAAALGELDILINNAGSLISRRPFLDADDEWVDAVFDLNARAVIHTSQAAVPYMERRGGGAIINVGSIAGLDGGGSGTGIYGAMRQSICLGRVAEPRDCVGAFLFLASRELSGYITGQNIHVNGGQAMP